ncbi:MAG: cysteine peptidase family C39 domain-containing protein [Blastocatellia bacterium]|nr:cysteine peptidase family C39 domain-containing protein [Blastocatellia bacterium]
MIQWFEQEHPAACIAACLRMVLSGLGVHCTEKELRRLLGNPRFGLTLGQSAIKLSECGAVAEWHSDWGMDDLRDSVRDGNYPIVGIERRYFGHLSAAHAVVVVAMHATEIEMLDPLLGPEPRLSQIETFAAAWHSAGQEVLILITPFLP